MKLLVLTSLLFSLFTIQQNANPTFKLTGKTSGIADGTQLFITNLETDETLDSVMITDNAFIFKTTLETSSPIRVLLYTTGLKHYKYLWLENKPMTFDASESDFRNAKIEGSETQKLSSMLNEKTKDLKDIEREKIEQDFVKQNPNSIVSVSLLSGYATTWGKQKTIELFETLSDENKNSNYGKKVVQYIKLNKDLQIDDEFVDIEMPDTLGNLKKLSDFKGKVVLLEFWGSWCHGCRQEHPNLVKTYQKYNDKGFDIFAVAMEKNKSNWIAAIKKDELTWTNVSEVNGEDYSARLIYGISEYPSSFLIDQNGKIVAKNLKGKALSKKIKQMLASKK